MKRFWDKVQKSDGCWIWTAYKQPLGYGVIGIKGKTVLAHRFAWEQANGVIPHGFNIFHQCGNASCVRPSHLSITPDELSRFWTKVKKTATCWVWVGARYPSGYGTFRKQGRNVGAHRAAWEIKNGPIPAGLQVLHHCDNPSCVNPSHLFLGTHQDNMDDRGRKGRTRCGGMGGGPPGERNGRAKLSVADVATIRETNGIHSVIAARYGVTRCTVSAIKRGTTWKCGAKG